LINKGLLKLLSHQSKILGDGTMQSNQRIRLDNQAGIAIGPILFVVAILAILATAIATNASQETNRTNAGAILQIGQTLKLGVDRIVGLGTPLTSVTQTGAATSADIFSITGGGLTPPSTALAAAPSTDLWIYSYAPVAGIGTATVDKIAFLKVTQGVCDQINILGANTTTNAAGYDPTGTGISSANVPAWDPLMSGKLAGCIRTITTTPGYWFFQVLGPQ
jgi:type II secretory pathway pseudopilin PulG